MKLEMVETFAINTDDTTLADKCCGVNIVDDTENLPRLAFFGEHEEHLHFIARVKTLSINYCYTPVRFLVDATGNLLVMM